MDARFATTFCARPEGVKVMGRRLKPFSLWHAAVLEMIESPFAGATCKGQASSLYELELASLVCAMKPDPARLRGPRLRTGRVAGMLRALRMRRWVKRFPREMEAFLTYHAEHCASPLYYDGDGTGLKTPWTLYLVMRMRELGSTLDAAWLMSPGRAMWYDAAAREAKGEDVKKLIGEKDQAVLREAGVI